MSDHEHHGPEHYWKIYWILCGLFAISVAGPLVADAAELTGATRLWTVLITAFGVAFVKAYLVCAKFMHLEIEKPIVHWFLGTALVFMVLFFAGTAPDVMKDDGHQWVQTAEIEWHQTSANYRAKHGDDGHHGEESPDTEDESHGEGDEH